MVGAVSTTICEGLGLNIRGFYSRRFRSPCPVPTRRDAVRLETAPTGLPFGRHCFQQC